ncbi:cobalamin biosynthesis protein, partial [Streptomyces sp. SID10115]
MEDVVLVVGVGACEDAPVEEVLGLVRDAVREAGLAESAVAELATVDVKGAEPGIVGAAARLGVPVVTYTAAELSDVTVPNPTARSR